MPKWYAEQIGPLPLGVWIAAGGGGIALAWYQNRHKSVAPAVTPNAGFLGTGIGGSGAIGLPSGTPGSTLPSGTPATGGPSSFTDNTQWANYVISQLVSRGYDPILVATTVGDYMAGNQLSATETQLFSTILTLIGPPPYPVALKAGPPITPTPTPTPAPSPSPAPSPAPTPAPAPAPSPSPQQSVTYGLPYLQPGSRGPAVSVLQAALWYAGSNPGNIDGYFGAQTEQSVLDFQIGHGMPQSGLIGADPGYGDWPALASAIGAGQMQALRQQYGA